MTRHSRLVPLAGLLLAVVLTGCGGSRPVDEASAEGDVSSSADNGGEDPDSGSDDDVDDQAQPGGPGGDSEGGGGDTDVEAQGGNPGAPGDVAVFEEGDVAFSVLRDDAAETCAHGVCTLADPVTTGDPKAVGGVGHCWIVKKSDISYNPPAVDGKFRNGATVTAHVDCTVGDFANSGNTDGDGADPQDGDGADPQDGEGDTQDDGNGDTQDDGGGDTSQDDGTGGDPADEG